MILVLLFVSYFLLPCLFFCSDKHPKSDGYSFVSSTYKKRGCLHLPVRRSRPTTAHSRKQPEKHPRGSILYTVKCASEDMVSPRSTLRRVYATPRGNYPCIVLVYYSICGSFETTKKLSVSNAFQYVVPHPSAPSSSDDITALRADSNCKDTNYFPSL